MHLPGFGEAKGDPELLEEPQAWLLPHVDKVKQQISRNVCEGQQCHTLTFRA